MNVSTSVPRWRIRATVDVLKQRENEDEIQMPDAGYWILDAVSPTLSVSLSTVREFNVSCCSRLPIICGQQCRAGYLRPNTGY